MGKVIKSVHRRTLREGDSGSLNRLHFYSPGNSNPPFSQVCGRWWWLRSGVLYHIKDIKCVRKMGIRQVIKEPPAWKNIHKTMCLKVGWLNKFGKLNRLQFRGWRRFATKWVGVNHFKCTKVSFVIIRRSYISGWQLCLLGKPNKWNSLRCKKKLLCGWYIVQVWCYSCFALSSLNIFFLFCVCAAVCIKFALILLAPLGYECCAYTIRPFLLLLLSPIQPTSRNEKKKKEEVAVLKNIDTPFVITFGCYLAS